MTSVSPWKPLDALAVAHDLRERLVELYLSEHHVTDAGLRDRLRAIWSGSPSDGGVVGQLWVEGAFPARASAVTLADLVARGEFPAELANHLDSNGAFPSDRRLFVHQLAALERATETSPAGGRPAVLVSAGTGAGKTEAFLLPLLRLLASPRAPGASGVRAILVYPLNALVNDQVDRIHSWLRGQDRVTVFHFTSETPEDSKAANSRGFPRFDAARVRTRKQARGLEDAEGKPILDGPVPDVLITNYSMLEYMLCRPQDAPFFGPALEAVVLDEAHVYAGTLAAEMSLLLRRVLERCGRAPSDVLALAVSATIGSDSDPLRSFAADLFSKPVEAVHVVMGERGDPALGPVDAHVPDVDPAVLSSGPWLVEPTLVPSPDEPESMTLAVATPTALDAVSRRLEALVSPSVVTAAREASDGRLARLLHAALRQAPIVHTLARLLAQGRPIELETLSNLLFPTAPREQATRAVVELLRLVAAARTTATDHPLLPHRLHVVVREPDGLVACLSETCSAPVERHLPPLGGLSTGFHDACPACGAALMTLVRCDECGEPSLTGLADGDRLLPVLADVSVGSTRWIWSNHMDRPAPGARVEVLDPATGQRLGEGANGRTLWAVDACPRCRSDAPPVPFSTVGSLAVTVVAETLLSSMPPFPTGQREWLPARGRRLLAFSDSRREAAALGPRLTQQHEALVVRGAIARIVTAESGPSPEELEELRADHDSLLAQAEGASWPSRKKLLINQAALVAEEIQRAQGRASMTAWSQALANDPVLAEVLHRERAEGHHAEGWSQKVWEQNRAAVAELAPSLLERELALRPRKGHSLESLGMVEVLYPGLEEVAFPDSLGARLPAKAADALEGAWPDFLAALCDDLRADGCVHLHDDEADADHPHAFVALGKWCSRETSGVRLESFVGETERKRRRRFAAAVLRQAGLPEHAAEELSRDLLAHAFDALLSSAWPKDAPHNDGPFAWLRRDTREVTRPGGKGRRRRGAPVTVEALQIHFEGLYARRPVALFRCASTGQVWPRSVLGCAPWPAGLAHLVPVTRAELDCDARLRRGRQELLESPVFRLALWAEEHSAQLSPQENRRLQDLFRVGARNVLSATTTLELGVDIGGLSGVFLANVPPGLANYLQRAGRAGRRADGSSVVVTFTRSRPYDREVFGRLGDYLERSLRRPIVIRDRERIARRHLHAYLLGEFFRELYPPRTHVGAMSAYGSVRTFFGLALPPWWDAKEAQKPAVPAPEPAVGRPRSVSWWNSSLREPRLHLQFESFLAWVRGPGRSRHEEAVTRLLADTPLARAVEDWSELLTSVSEAFAEVHSVGSLGGASAHRSIVRDYEDLLASWRAVNPAEDGARRRANAIRHQIKALLETTVIEALADRRFLPRYGFPIHLHRLRVIAPQDDRKRATAEETFRLERPSLLALREYAPGSKLLVGGRIVHSRGILRHWSGKDVASEPGLTAWLSRCPNGHDYTHLVEAQPPCTVCGEEPHESGRLLFFPKHGFTTAAWDPPRYGLDVSGAGTSEACAPWISLGVGARARASGADAGLRVVDVGGITGLAAEYREEGEILVLNRGRATAGFAICTSCGYADSERAFGDGRAILPSGFERHPPIDSPRPFPCWSSDEAPVLRNRLLGARDVTDLLLLDPEHLSLPTDLRPTAQDRVPLSATLACALQYAGAALLEVDSRELATLVVEQPRGPVPGIVVYDNVPGGAGHVRELLERAREWFFRALGVLHGTTEHHGRCESACFDCLIAFDAPPPAALRRRRTHAVWSHWLQAVADDRDDPRCASCGERRGSRTCAHGTDSATEQRTAQDRAGSNRNDQ